MTGSSLTEGEELSGTVGLDGDAAERAHVCAEAEHLYDRIQSESRDSGGWASLGRWARETLQHALSIAAIPEPVLEYFRQVGELLPETEQCDIDGVKALELEREMA